MGYIYNIVWDFAKIRTFWIISMQITAFFLQATQLFCLFCGLLRLLFTMFTPM